MSKEQMVVRTYPKNYSNPIGVQLEYILERSKL